MQAYGFTERIGKENLSKEDAIEAAKQACKKNGHLGFVVVDAWQTLFYKSHPDVGKPSLKWTNKGKKHRSARLADQRTAAGLEHRSTGIEEQVAKLEEPPAKR